MRIGFVLLLACLLVPVGGAPAAPSPSCSRFVVGKANSSAYSGMRLPARGTARGSSCSTLKRMARRLQSGAYAVPDSAIGGHGRFGRRFTVTDRGRDWSCRFKSLGGSGPSYVIRCSGDRARLRWRTG